MSILARFNDIVKANINVMLDKMEDPSKMIDQYLRDMMEDLSEVKKETAGVMAEETRTLRLTEENTAEINKYTDLAKKALAAGNEADARVFLEKKQKLEANAASLQSSYETASQNAEKMREMHDKLVKDIEDLKARREAVKAKVAVAKTQETLNKVAPAAEKSRNAMSAFDRMEDKADQMLDAANAMADLNKAPVDQAKSLEEKYASASASVDDEMAKLKKEMGL